jgi:transposase
MNVDLKCLPDNASLPKHVVISLIETYQEKTHYLEEQIRLLKNEIFGRSSEKRQVISSDQIPLFHTIEDIPDPKPKEEIIAIPAHERKKPGRKPLPKDLLRIDMIHDISRGTKTMQLRSHVKPDRGRCV